MSAKNVDRHNRFRNITVGFRVSPEEQAELNRAVALSGLSKQEYCYAVWSVMWLCRAIREYIKLSKLKWQIF